MGLDEIWANLWKSLLNDKEGFSVKKAIAVFVCVCVIMPLSFMYTDRGNWIAILGILVGFVTALLGIAAKEKNDILKAKKKDDEN